MYGLPFLQQIGFGTAGAVWAPRPPSSEITTAAETSARPPATGPRRVHPQNPRYSTDATGKAVAILPTRAR